MELWVWFSVLSGLFFGNLSAHASGPGHRLVPLDDLIPPQVRIRIDKRHTSLESQAAIADFDAWMQKGKGSPPVAPSMDLRYRDTPVKHQFGGTCSAFGLVAAMENLLGGTLELSERHAWSKYRKYSSKAAEATLEKSGIVEERYWPADSHLPKPGFYRDSRYKISKARYIEDDVRAAIQALEAGTPLYFGVADRKSVV